MHLTLLCVLIVKENVDPFCHASKYVGGSFKNWYYMENIHLQVSKKNEKIPYISYLYYYFIFISHIFGAYSDKVYLKELLQDPF